MRMTQVVRVKPNKELIDAVWPTFLESVVHKHGDAGAIGQRGEDNALKLLAKEYEPKALIDHGQDALMQLLGIDITMVTYDGVMTIDVKSGKTALYYDAKNKRWFLSIKSEWLLNSKRNEYIMLVGPKGDRFCLFHRKPMTDLFNTRPDLFRNGKYAFELDADKWPHWIKHNFSWSV